jgi:hypothetical protein
MTDYEMYYLIIESASVAFTVFATYLTIIFAFLVVGYLVSHKLHASMVAIVVFLFSLASLLCTLVVVRASEGMIGLTSQVGRAIREGHSGLTWTPYGDPNSAIVNTVLTTGIPTLFFLAYAGALIFFFHQRKTGLRGQAT